MKKDVTLWCRQCVACQTSKISTNTRTPFNFIPVLGRRFQTIHIDLTGPLPMSQRKSYLFTIIDRTFRWFKAVPLSSTTSAECALALVNNWISRYGMPEQVVSHRGPQFTSSVWNHVSRFLVSRRS